MTKVFVSEGFTVCTVVTHSVLRPSKWVRKVFSGGKESRGRGTQNGWTDGSAIDNNVSVFKLEM